MSEYATIEYYVNHIMSEITKRDVEQVSERLRALGWEEVVRCRDCKHHHEGECMLSDGMGDFKRWLVDDDDYCSDGERAVGA